MKSIQSYKFIRYSLLIGVSNVSMGLTLPSGENLEVVNGSIKTVGPVIINKSSAEQNTSVAVYQPALLLGSNNSNLGTGGGLNPGRGLAIGENNMLATDVNNQSGYGLVVGYENQARVYGAIVTGSGNTIAPNAWNPALFSKFTSVFGKLNTVNAGNNGSYASLVFGGDNMLTGDYTTVGGRFNTVGGATLGSETTNSFAVGDSNMIASETAWAIGSGNILTGKESSAYGTGLSAIHRGITVLGSYNADPIVTGAGSLDLRTNYFSGSPLLVVGNGTASNARSNALILRRSGDLEIAGSLYQGGQPIATQNYVSTVVSSLIDNKLESEVVISGGYAAGNYSTAISGGSAIGTNATALAGGEAWADNAVAIKGSAGAENSVAIMGMTDGKFSVAIGPGVVAKAHGSIAIGSFNETRVDQNSEAYVSTDELFVVGNGWFNPIGHSNAIETLKNGQTTLTNKFWSNSSSQSIPTNAAEASNGNALVVEGHSRLKGNTVMDGQVTITQVQGDINPGIYQ